MTSHLERVCKSFSARQIAVAASIGDKAMLHEPTVLPSQPSSFAANEARQSRAEISPDRSTSCLCYAISRWISTVYC